MYTQEDFCKGIMDCLSMNTSGALMISGAWGSGKTYYVDNVLIPLLRKKDLFPIKISLFGLNSLDSLELRVAEIFLQEYGEESLNPLGEKDGAIFSRLFEAILKKVTSKDKHEVQSITDTMPVIGQYVDVGRVFDSYTMLCLRRLPKDKVVLILDDLERAVKTIPAHILLGTINSLMETDKYKVVLIANDSYFNIHSKEYLDFKEKVIDRTLLFPQNIRKIYSEIIKGYGTEFEKLMSDGRFTNVIDPYAGVNRGRVDIQEDLNNIRILKFAVAHFAKVYDSLADTIREYPEDESWDEYLLSLWALTVGLSIEYKRNRLTYHNRAAYISASAVDSFVIDLVDDEESPFGDEPNDDQAGIEAAVKSIRSLFKKYIGRHGLPLIASVQVFDLITMGVLVDNKQMADQWHEYRLSLERQKENPAVILLNRFMRSMGSFTNEEFPENLLKLAEYVEHGMLTNDVSYINAATYLQRYGLIAGVDQEYLKQIITRGVDRHYEHIEKLQPNAKTNLEIIASDIPKVSQWVLEYIRTKIDAQIAKEATNDTREVVRQFKEDLVGLSKRLCPVAGETAVPDFFLTSILDKIPENIIVAKLKDIQPGEVRAIVSIIKCRFLDRSIMQSIGKDEMTFLEAVQKGIQSRNSEKKVLSDFLIEDELEPLIARLQTQKTI